MALQEKIEQQQNEKKFSILSSKDREDFERLLTESTGNWIHFREKLSSMVKDLNTLLENKTIRESCFYDDEESNDYFLKTPNKDYKFNLCGCFDDYNLDDIEPAFVSLFWVNNEINHEDMNEVYEISNGFKDIEDVRTIFDSGYLSIRNDGVFNEDKELLTNLSDAKRIIAETNKKCSIAFDKIIADIEEKIVAFYK